MSTEQRPVVDAMNQLISLAASMGQIADELRSVRADIGHAIDCAVMDGHLIMDDEEPQLLETHLSRISEIADRIAITDTVTEALQRRETP